MLIAMAEHDVEANPKFATCGEPRLAQFLLLRLAPVEVFQVRVFAYYVHRCFTPEKAQQRVALFARFAEPLPPVAGMFAGESCPRSLPALCRRRIALGHPRTRPWPTP